MRCSARKFYIYSVCAVDTACRSALAVVRGNFREASSSKTSSKPKRADFVKYLNEVETRYRFDWKSGRDCYRTDKKSSSVSINQSVQSVNGHYHLLIVHFLRSDGFLLRFQTLLHNFFVNICDNFIHSCTLFTGKVPTDNKTLSATISSAFLVLLFFYY